MLPSNVVVDCATLDPKTVYLHREDIFFSQAVSASTTWFFSNRLSENWAHGQRLNNNILGYINTNALSVYMIDGDPALPHQKCEPLSKGCWCVDASFLKKFWLLPDKATLAHHFDVNGVRNSQSPRSQHLNLVPKCAGSESGTTIHNAWADFNSAPWEKCWNFKAH